MVKPDPTNVVVRKRRRVVVGISMRPVDNFSAPRLARLSIRAGACRRVGVCGQVSRFIRRGSLGDRGNDLECRGSAATERSSLRVSAGDFPDLGGRVPSVERQRAANGHRRRTRRRPWRSARVFLVVLRGFRPPEKPGAEPFSECVRQLCESPLLELARGTRAVVMI